MGRAAIWCQWQMGDRELQPVQLLDEPPVQCILHSGCVQCGAPAHGWRYHPEWRLRELVTPAAGATQVAAEQLGNSLVAYRPVSGGHTTVGVTAYVGADSTQSGDWGKVIVNAGRWLGGSCAPVPSSAVSRKVHGAFTGDINLPLVAIGGAVGIECRNGAGAYQMVVTFPSPVTVGGVSVTSGTGSVGSSSVSGGVVTINLTGVTDAQRLGVTLANVNDGTNTGDVLVPMGVLIGDSAGQAMAA